MPLTMTLTSHVYVRPASDILTSYLEKERNNGECDAVVRYSRGDEYDTKSDSAERVSTMNGPGEKR